MSDSQQKQLEATANNINSVSDDPFEGLTDIEKIAVEMRVNNFPFHVVAETVKKKNQTVRAWFMKGGRLHDVYVRVREERATEYAGLFESIRESIREGAVEAIAGLRNDIKQKGMVGLLARRDILDRAGFKPPDKMEIESKIPVTVNVNVVKKYPKDAAENT
jgi:hypothetical protein